jgi:hypothetical protein
MKETNILEPVGLQGSPAETLEAITHALRGFDIRHAVVTVIADWQDRRESARYAVLVRSHNQTVLSEDAFGPRYGQAGTDALSKLITGLVERGAINFKESVLAPHAFSRLLEYPDTHALLQVAANANPAGPDLYVPLVKH